MEEGPVSIWEEAQVTQDKENSDNKALRALYEEDDYAKAVLDDFAGRTNNQRVTEVEQLMRRLRNTELPKWAAIKLFRRLDELGYGRFIVGRKGSPSRFKWSAKLAEVGRAAQGQNLAITSVPEQDPAEPDMVSHQFALRPGMTISFDLPADFTDREAERLSQFLRALPFATE